MTDKQNDSLLEPLDPITPLDPVEPIDSIMAGITGSPVSLNKPEAGPVSLDKPEAGPVSLDKPKAEPVSLDKPKAGPVSLDKPKESEVVYGQVVISGPRTGQTPVGYRPPEPFVPVAPAAPAVPAAPASAAPAAPAAPAPRVGTRLSYMKGGAPATLAILLFIQGILGLVAAVFALIDIITVAAAPRYYYSSDSVFASALPTIILLPLVIIPTFLIGLGALKLFRAKMSGTVLIAVGCKMYKIMLIISMVVLALGMTVAAITTMTVTSSGAALIGAIVGLLVLGGVLVMIIFMIRYYNAIRETMPVVRSEMTLGSISYRSFHAPTGLAIMMAVFSGLLLVLLLVAPFIRIGYGYYGRSYALASLGSLFPSIIATILGMVIRILIVVVLSKFNKAHREADAA